MGQTRNHPRWAGRCCLWRSPIGDRQPAIPARRPRRPRNCRAGRAFTLIEAALATVIVGTGVLSILAAQQAYHIKNDWSQRVGTAVLLANELRELTLTLPVYDPLYGTSQLGPRSDQTTVASYDNVCDFAGTVTGGVGTGLTFAPPINALRQQIPNMANWSQVINVTNVLPDNISSTFTQPLGTTNLVRVTVTINYTDPNTKIVTAIYSTAWIVGVQSQ